MRYRIREIAETDKLSSLVTLEALSHAVPQATIADVLQAHDAVEQRERKLSMVMVVWALLAMALYPTVSLGGVLRKISQGLRFVSPDPEAAVPTGRALSYRRYQLGARPLASLFQAVCHPLATAQTNGAFLYGLRLMAIDGTKEDVPDTPANAASFGRHHSDRGQSAYPQVKAVYLAECGTHAIVDAGFWPCHTSERVGGRRLLRRVGPGLLLMWDCGFHEYDMVAGTVQRGAHVLARVPISVRPQHVRTLADGSYLAYLRPSEAGRRKAGERLLVRIIDYTFTDPALPGYGAVHRLVTTLLDPTLAPALELICAYHERWEIELVVDEIATHQRLCTRTLRSLHPVGVIQELSALLIAHYAVRTVMHDAALAADVDPDRLSFVHALQVLHAAFPEFQMVAPQDLPRLYRRLLQDSAATRLPERRLRINPRVVKRKMSNFHLKRPEHYHLPPLTRPFAEMVAVI